MLAWLSVIPIGMALNFIFKFFCPPANNEADESLISKSSSSFPQPDLWGTYRSNLYFGVKTKTHNSAMTGLAWNSVSDITGITSKTDTLTILNF